MSEPSADSRGRGVIPQDLLLARLAQSEQMRAFFIQMWLQNPLLARQGGVRVRAMLEEIASIPAGR